MKLDDLAVIYVDVLKEGWLLEMSNRKGRTFILVHGPWDIMEVYSLEEGFMKRYGPDD